MSTLMRKPETNLDGDTASKEREALDVLRELKSMYEAKLKAVSHNIRLLERSSKRGNPLSGVGPLEAAVSILEENKGKHSYPELVKGLVAEGCCDDTSFPSRSVAAGLKKGIRDGKLMADSAEDPKYVWLPESSK